MSFENYSINTKQISERVKQKIKNRKWRQNNILRSRATSKRYRLKNHDKELVRYKKYDQIRNKAQKNRNQMICYYRNIAIKKILAQDFLCLITTKT